MTTKTIETLLTQALLNNGKMELALYEHELEEHLDFLKTSLKQDKEDYIFTVTENTGHVAMVLIEKSGKIYINEQAREKLQSLWPAAYESNIKGFIPSFAKQLAEGELPITGVIVTK
jgi:frataxin-like iron-binding protein CyaY